MPQAEPDLEWNEDTLTVDEHGHVDGQAWYGLFGDGYDVFASVTSYDYERGGQTRTNHVPHVVVTDNRGSVIAEPHVHDTQFPEKAIKAAKDVARGVVANPEQFID